VSTRNRKWVIGKDAECWIVCVLALWCSAAAGVTLTDLATEEPDFKLLSLEGRLTDATYETIKQIPYVESDEDKHLLYQQLSEDRAAPMEVRRWATFNVMMHFGGVGESREGLRVGEAWLNAHPDDPTGIRLRCAMARTWSYHSCSREAAQYVGREISEEFVPSTQERLDNVRRLLDPIFTKYREPTRDLVMAHHAYAGHIRRLESRLAGDWVFSGEARSLSPQERELGKQQRQLAVYEERLEHLEAAKGLIERVIRDPSATEDAELLRDREALLRHTEYWIDSTTKCIEIVRRRIEGSSSRVTDAAAEEVLEDLVGE